MMIKKKKTIPPEVLQVRITTIFNNLNQLNLKQKCDEIRKIMTDDYWLWTVQYLITKCVSVKLKFHTLYSNFFDCLKIPEVSKMVAQETYENIKIILQNDEKSIHFSDQLLLKNLGHWLGILTLRKNKPILQNDFDIKRLLLEAYHKGQQKLLFVVPFVTKILENCAQSYIFRPPNPWTMAIIRVLVELRQDLSIEYNIKFEIEILCNTLNINIAEVKHKNYLQNSKKLKISEYQLLDNRKETPDQDRTEQHVDTALVKKAALGPAQFIYTISSFSTTLPENFVIDNQLPLFQACPHLKQLVKPAIEQTIREWIHPVTEKSLKMSLTTTEHIIRKDFALESDVNRMKNAARQMVSTLTAGIAMIVCTDQILTSISNNLKQAFTFAMVEPYQSQKDIIDQTANIVAANNLELTRSFVQKSAIERAMIEIDRRLFNDIQLREDAYLSGRCYFDPKAINQAENMPEQIRLMADGITCQQMIVYDEFEQNISNFLLLDRAPTVPTVNLESRIYEDQDQNGNARILWEKTEFLLQEWIKIHQCSQYESNPTQFFESFVQQMNAQGVFRTDDSLMKFFKISTRMCVDYCYRILADSDQVTTETRTQCLLIIDALVHLIAQFVKHSGNVANISTKINLLNKILETVAEVLIEDHEVQGINFQQLPYHRIFAMLFLELCTPEPFLETINYQVLISFCHIFHIIRPEKVSGFCFAWLEFISHQAFIGRMLALSAQQKCQEMHARLLTDLFRYLAPHLRNPTIAKSTLTLYKGTLRVLLMLLHDFPVVLSDYYYEFCDVIPLNCIQMKNIILSALPKNVRSSDPLSSDMKIKMLPEITHALSTIQPLNFKEELDLYLRTQTPENFLSKLKNKLGAQVGMRYSIRLINALVLYLGVQAMATLFNKGHALDMTTIMNSVHMEIFQNLLEDFDTEGRYLLLSSIVNHLRYPNAYTHYFSYTVLCLFVEANSEVVQEQITRVLLERLMVNKPYPWGLLTTFVELIRNPVYRFWTHNFVYCAPEFRRFFDAVTGSFGLQRQLGLLSLE